jgi:hypothetical protein
MQRLGRVFGNVLAVMLAVFSLHAMAEASLAGRDFNHSATGFPLTGGHATAACETCHVAGVFKGTAKECDGCHALGKRVVATPKSTSHIVTDAPCDTCHFNSSTFLGARYNHGTALPGQCVTCHNGRISTGRPANHNAGLMLTGSCDNCHRSYAFLPASWNHSGVAMGAHTCNQAGCHLPGGGNANQYTYATAVTPVNHSSYADTNSKSCDVCHLSFVTWSSPMHEPITGACSSCHNGANAQGQSAGHISTTAECNQCHTSTTTWLGALGGMPAGHVINTAPACTSCHPTPTTVLTGAATHVFYSTACNSCHYKGGTTPYTSLYPIQQSSHAGNSNCSSGSCHAPAGSRGTAYVRWSN